MKERLLSGLLLAVFLSSCGEANPLLGEWQVKSGPDTVAQTIRFTDDQLISSNSVDNVDYEIQDGQVTVISSLGFRQVYTLVDTDTIQVSLPGSGEVTYSRADQ